MPLENPDTVENDYTHTDDIRDIITKPPPALVRWGILIFFLILILVAGLSVTIRYPDTVTAKLIVRFYRKPSVVKTNVSGSFEKIMVDEHAHVKAGDILAYTKAAQPQQVLSFLKELYQIKRELQQNPADRPHLTRSGNEFRGELHQSYLTFQKQYNNSKNKMSRLKVTEAMIVYIKGWVDKYILTSPQKGTVLFIGIVNVEKQYEKGQSVFLVQPDDKSFYGELIIPANQIRKVSAGQKVYLDLVHYGYDQDELRGAITHVSDIPSRSGYFEGEVIFSKNTTINSKAGKLPIMEGLVCNAEIITRDVSILRRISKTAF